MQLAEPQRINQWWIATGLWVVPLPAYRHWGSGARPNLESMPDMDGIGSQ
jgi:hypothetical protein